MKICERCKKDIEGLEFHTCNKKQEVSAVASNDGVMPLCTTHHYACQCREWKIRETLKGVIQVLRSKKLSQEYVYLNELYIDLYGEEA